MPRNTAARRKLPFFEQRPTALFNPQNPFREFHRAFTFASALRRRNSDARSASCSMPAAQPARAVRQEEDADHSRMAGMMIDAEQRHACAVVAERGIDR